MNKEESLKKYLEGVDLISQVLGDFFSDRTLKATICRVYVLEKQFPDFDTELRKITTVLVDSYGPLRDTMPPSFAFTLFTREELAEFLIEKYKFYLYLDALLIVLKNIDIFILPVDAETDRIATTLRRTERDIFSLAPISEAARKFMQRATRQYAEECVMSPSLTVKAGDALVSTRSADLAREYYKEAADKMWEPNM
jgi:hypothetical protein